MDIRRLVEFVMQYELSAEIALKLYAQCGAYAIQALNDNPYILVDEKYGVRFAEADRFAMELGVQIDSALRYEAGLKYVLMVNMNNGHVFIPYDKLCSAAMSLLQAKSLEDIQSALDGLVKKGEIVRDNICKTDACYLKALYEAESYVAQRLFAQANRVTECSADIDSLMDEAQVTLGIRYSEKQAEAVLAAVSGSLLVLTGGPGTGKTTAIRGMLWMYDQMGLKVELAAPTGRAAKRMSEVCGREAKTIHRLLEAGYSENGIGTVFNRDEDNPVDCDVLVVDELSMVDILLLRSVLEAARDDTRLVFVGDSDQLPSVGPGNTLRDMIRSGCVPTVALDEIFRQEDGSRIVVNAHRINRGILPEAGNAQDYFFMKKRSPEETAVTIADLCRQRLPDYYHVKRSSIQVLTPSRQRECGCISLNRRLQQELNPHSAYKREMTVGSTLFREGDRVMQMRNNYDILWRKADGSQAGAGVYNGDIGAITAINTETELITVHFDDDRVADYTPDEAGELDLAYAITVHKSQGSEFPIVVLAISDADPRLLYRNLLYTAVTRAKKCLVIVGDHEIFRQMVENGRQNRRYSALHARIYRLAAQDCE